MQRSENRIRTEKQYLKKSRQDRRLLGRRKNVRLSQAEELERFVDTIRPQEAMDIIPREKTLTDSEKKNCLHILQEYLG